MTESRSLTFARAASMSRPSGLVVWSFAVYSASAAYRFSVSGAYPTSRPSFLLRKVRFTRASACMSAAPRIGLSTYMVCSGGESNPVSHIDWTITSSSSSSGSLARRWITLFCEGRRKCFLICAGSVGPPV